MKRMLSALAVLLLLALAAPAAEPKVTIRWHGQSFFEILSPEGVRIVTDPHEIEAFGRKSVKADLILMSHLHDDHTRIDVVENKDKAKKIQALRKLDKEGTRTAWNDVDVKMKDVHVRMVHSYHDNVGGLKRGKNGIFVIDVGGLRIVHLGDLGHVLKGEQVKALDKVDVLLIPIGGIYTINGLDAQRIVERIKPRRVIIPMHYGAGPYTDLLDLEKSHFLDEQEMGVVKRYLITNEISINPKAEVPKEPTVAILSWEKKAPR
jgi:L-ascorbate metabolism protein UlaG (beta-lactamase superfamily)